MAILTAACCVASTAEVFLLSPRARTLLSATRMAFGLGAAISLWLHSTIPMAGVWCISVIGGLNENPILSVCCNILRC